MTRPAASLSIGNKLSATLAVQGAIAAVLVSALVYGANAWLLRQRQLDELRHKQEVVQHAFAETANTGDVAELRHKLEDFLAGHSEMRLRVHERSGRLLYESASRSASAAEMSRSEEAAWVEDWPVSSPEPFHVRLQVDVGADDRLLRRLAITLFAASLAVTAVVSLTGRMLVRRGLRPMRALQTQIESLSLERPGLRLDSMGQPDELIPLVDRFNVLLARVERAYEQLEAFNADVAHELRTPLTTLIGASELALRRPRTNSELLDIIAGNLEDAQRLAAIVNDILFLARADRGSLARRERVDSLAATLQPIVEFHEAELQERGLSVTSQGDKRGAFDLPLLQRVVSNLLSNACRFASTGSAIALRIEDLGARARVVVVNRGDDIPASHLSRLLDRFYRAERSRSPPVSNHGLGLAIVAAIARMHGGEVIATSEAGVTTIGIEIAAS